MLLESVTIPLIWLKKLPTNCIKSHCYFYQSMIHESLTCCMHGMYSSNMDMADLQRWATWLWTKYNESTLFSMFSQLVSNKIEVELEGHINKLKLSWANMAKAKS